MGRPGRTVADKRLMKDMGRRLRWVRESLGLSQQKLASLLGVDQTTLSLWELGKRWPDQFAAARLTARLKISQQYLLDGSLKGVERELAIALAAAHPELAPPRSTARYTDTAQA